MVKQLPSKKCSSEAIGLKALKMKNSNACNCNVTSPSSNIAIPSLQNQWNLTEQEINMVGACKIVFERKLTARESDVIRGEDWKGNTY